VFTRTIGAAQVWDGRTGAALTPPLRHDGAAAAVGVGTVFTHDESRILTWTYNSARLWDARTGLPITAPLRHAGLMGVRFDKAEEHVLTWGRGTARVWSLAVDETVPPDQLLRQVQVRTGTRYNDVGVQRRRRDRRSLRGRMASYPGPGADAHSSVPASATGVGAVLEPLDRVRRLLGVLHCSFRTRPSSQQGITRRREMKEPMGEDRRGHPGDQHEQGPGP
jgi:hypothetical protein